MKALHALKAQCEDFKLAANSLTEENTKLKTRLMSIEHDLQRRDRLLKLLSSSQLGRDGRLGHEVIEKLREERNMIPIFRRKEQDLRRQIEAKEEEVQKLKRHHDFTRIVELQVEAASWQHEALRLDSLLQQPSPERNEVARAEIEVHETRVEKLKAELRDAEEKRETLEDDLSHVAASYERARENHVARQGELGRLQSDMEELASAVEGLQTEFWRVDALDREVKGLQAGKREYEQELQQLEERCTALGEVPQFGRCAVTEAAMLHQLPLCQPDELASLWAVRRNCATPLDGQAALLTRLRDADGDSDGLLTIDELAEALRPCRLPVPAEECAELLRRRLASDPSAPEGRVRWLDLLVSFDRLGGACATSPPPPRPEGLPELRPLRAACLKSKTNCEDLRQRLMGVGSSAEAEELFGALGLPEPSRGQWAGAWRAHGTAGLLLRLPLSEAAPSEEDRRSWWTRCQTAIFTYRKTLQQGFEDMRADPQSKELLLTEETFRMICTDMLCDLMLEADVDDLALLASRDLGGSTGGPPMVDGAVVLQRGQ